MLLEGVVVEPAGGGWEVGGGGEGGGGEDGGDEDGGANKELGVEGGLERRERG